MRGIVGIKDRAGASSGRLRSRHRLYGPQWLRSHILTLVEFGLIQ